MTPTIKPKDRDLLDPVQVALEITQLRGEQAGLTQQLNQAIGNMGGTLQAVQGELRAMQTGQQAISDQLFEFRQHSTGLERLGAEIREAVRENMDWRKAHALENDGVADNVTFWRGMVVGIAAVFTLLTGAVIFIVQDGFAQGATERARIERQHQSDIDRLERTIDRQGSDIRQLEEQRGVIRTP
jgi:hypothetical protein